MAEKAKKPAKETAEKSAADTAADTASGGAAEAAAEAQAKGSAPTDLEKAINAAKAAGAADETASAEAGDLLDEILGGADEEPDARVVQLESEVAQLKDRLLRALADAENTRRRAERDRADAATYGGTRLARDVLAVYDNLDRALAAADDGLRETASEFIAGVELTQRELLSAFAKHKIEEVSPAAGEKFDPNFHQAMFEAPAPGAAPGTVIQVMQAGFKIGDRLLRPAMVGVAKADPGAKSAAKDAGGAAKDAVK